MFKTIHKKFEKSDTDLNKLQLEEGFSRYLLVRTLEPDHLKFLINETVGVVSGSRAETLYEELYNSQCSNERIIEYIRSEYPKVKQVRQEQEEHLPAIVSNYGSIKCGVRNDNLNDAVKFLVRDKSIQDKTILEERVDALLLGTIKGYIMWQYYNQATNDLIEHIFNDHPKVIPTLRKIKYVDFMMQIDGKIIPFDLKITHISDDYFDLFSKGLRSVDAGSDEFSVLEAPSEIDRIKDHYKKYKSELSLPNFGGLKKTEILSILEGLDHTPTKEFLEKIYADRARMVEALPENLKSLEWWNYKFQGERLFKNNNRFFVFLAYKDSYEDARPLKGNLELIKEKVSLKLDEVHSGRLNTIRYYYQKDKGLEGSYQVQSTSVIVIGSAGQS